MKKSMLFVVFFLWTITLTFTGVANAQEYPLGDNGIPSDYYSKLKSFQGKLETSLPSSFNWKTQCRVTTAKNQGSCGSCWAFASVGALESKLIIANGPMYDLSEQQLISCSSYGCNGGSMTAIDYWITHGPMLESCTSYPSYLSNEPACSTLSACTELNYRVSSRYTVDTGNISAIKYSLYEDGPAYFRFDVYYDFLTYWSTGSYGSVYVNSSTTLSGGHAVLLIGWDDSKQAWLCKNSWGEYRGPNNDGTFWMAYSNHNSDLNIGMSNFTIVPFSPPAPTINSLSLYPNQFDKSENSYVTYTYNLYTGQNITSFIRRIRNSSGQYINPNTGDIDTSATWWDWTELNFTSCDDSYRYYCRKTFNPYNNYYNWEPGVYTIEVRAINQNGTSATKTLSVTIVETPPVLSNFTVTPNTYSKSNNSSVPYTYRLTASKYVDEFQRQIKLNGQCINPETGQVDPTTCYLTWTELSTGSSSIPCEYVANGTINPSVSFSNWAPGTYYIYVKGRNSEGWSNYRILTITITE